jgi:hypothetical protein
MRQSIRCLWAGKKMVLAGICIVMGGLVASASAAGRYIDNGDGTVTDAITGLMWAATDNGSPINWPDARRYCQNYIGGGHVDWRMPTLAELSSLYDANLTNKNGYHLTESIETTAASCWALETRGNEAARFNFTYGNTYWLRQPYAGPTRVLPVRRGN